MPILSNMSNVAQRIISAVILAPLVLIAAWQGGWLWIALVAVVGIICVWEWVKITQSQGPRIGWLVWGLIYLIPPIIGLAMLHKNTTNVIVLLCIIWSVDIGAYIFGRLIGGPKIAPKISPNKTWAGLVGGIIFAYICIILLISFFLRSVGEIWSLKWMLVAAIAAVAAQAGDFFESWVKRKFGVKDSSNIIPGHGGVLDRVDGLLALTWLLMLYIGIFFIVIYN